MSSLKAEKSILQLVPEEEKDSKSEKEWTYHGWLADGQGHVTRNANNL